MSERSGCASVVIFNRVGGNFALMLSFYVGVECRVAEIRFSTLAVIISTLLILPGSSFILNATTMFLMRIPRFLLRKRLRIFLIHLPYL